MAANRAGHMVNEERSLDAYLRDVRGYPRISRSEEVELSERIRRGDEEALEQLVCANLRFVVAVAKKHQNCGLSLPELICEGNVGLVEAGRRFDGTKGFKFISYAVWWIRQSILKALLEQPRVVRIPLNRMGEAQKIEKGAARLEQQYGRAVTAGEIAAGVNMSEERLEQAVLAARPHLSLDSPGHTDGGRPLMDTIPVRDAAFEETPSEQRLGFRVEKILDSLEDREAEVITRYFGLGGREPEPFGQIAASFGLTRERMRQVKEAALDKIRQRLSQCP